MEATIACVAPDGRRAKALADGVASRVPGQRVAAFSMAGYLAAEAPASRVVLCPKGLSVAEDLAFLALAAGRLLWPAPPARLAQAIGGLRNAEGPRAARRRAPAGRTPGGLTAALLLEGLVDPARARAALAATGPRDWIVETPGRVHLSRGQLDRLARSGVRWSALEPITLVALYATPELARAQWKRLLPSETLLWVRDRSPRPLRAI
jgi:hypothetical protein